jgi:hypothetical protein
MLYDYWTAKQTGWMVKVVVEELVSHKELPDSEVRSDLESLTKILNLQFTKDAPQASVLNGLQSTLSIASNFRRDECEAIFQRILSLLEPHGPAD